MNTRYLRTALGLALLGSALHFAAPGAAEAATGQEPSSRPQGPPPGRGPGHSPEQQAAELARKLKLSDKQKQEVAAIFQDQHQQLEALRGSNPPAAGDREKGLEQMRRLQTDTDARLKGVLTAAQYQQYEAQRPQPGGPRGNKDGKRGKSPKGPKTGQSAT